MEGLRVVRVGALAGVVIIAGAAAGILAGCANVPAPLKLGKPDVEVIAHRGASAYAPENTIAAFEMAAEQKADWFELDCMLTADGEVVVIHDDTLDRTTTGEGPVAEHTLAEIQALDAGGWKSDRFAGERVPSLAETLDWAKGTLGVYVEIKNSDDDAALMEELLELAEGTPVMDAALAETMMAAVEASGSRNLALTRRCIALIRERTMHRDVVIQSFSPVICLVAKAEAPEMRVELLGGGDGEDPAQWPRFERWAYLLDVDGLNTNLANITPGRLAAIQAADKTVAIYTINDPREIARLGEMGVDRIITDRPDVALRTLERIGRR